MIERVEVIRGGGSVLYGSRAIGGVINFITKKGGHHPVQISYSSLFDTATDGRQVYGSIYGSYEGFDYRLAATDSEHDDRDTPDGEIDNTSFENDSVYFYLGKNWEKHKLALSYDNYDSSSEVYVDPADATIPPLIDFQIEAPVRDREKIALFYTGEDFSDTLKEISFDAYYQNSDREFNTFPITMFDFGFPLTRETSIFTRSELETVGADLQFDFSFSDSNYLILGVTFKDDSLKQNRRREVVNNGVPDPVELVDDKAEQQSFEIYAQDELTVVDDLILTLGARNYWIDSELEETTRPGLFPNSTSDSRLIGTAALSFTGIEDSTLWARFSQGYVFPSLTNLAIGAFAGSSYVSPNPDLEPETSNSLDLGFRYDDDTFTFDISTFYTESKDFIDHVRCSSTTVTCVEPTGSRDRVYVNIDKATSFGAEAFFSYTQEPFEPYTNLTWVRRKFENGSSETYNTGIPSVSARTGLKLERYFSSDFFGWVDFFIRTASESNELDSRGAIEHKGGWTTYNLALGSHFGKKAQYKISLEFLNLSDKRYIPSTENLPGRGRSGVLKFVVNL